MNPVPIHMLHQGIKAESAGRLMKILESCRLDHRAGEEAGAPAKQAEHKADQAHKELLRMVEEDA